MESIVKILEEYQEGELKKEEALELIQEALDEIRNELEEENDALLRFLGYR